MDRILIIGCSGGGKSTIARELSDILGIEVIHLDKVLWKSGCRLTHPQAEPDAVKSLLDQPQWIIDGNYTASLPMRLAEADTVVMIDFSRMRCLLRALRRLFQFRGTTRPDMGANCPEEFNLHLLRWIWNYPHVERPELVKQLQEHGSHAQVVVLKTPADVEHWLVEVRKIQNARKEIHAGRSN
jgi:adenylate kinase family enzyme